MSTTEEYYETSWDQYQDYRQTYCYICDHYTYAAYMEKREDGNFYCDRCAFIPPYSDALYNGLVGFQRLFRAYFAAKAKVCGKCGNSHLHLHEFRKYMSPICSSCMEDEIDEMREQYEGERECSTCYHHPCRCEDDAGPCEDCGNPYECICLEQKEDARLFRHRRICGFPDCDGGCGTLDCGCIDKCKCPLDFGED